MTFVRLIGLVWVSTWSGMAYARGETAEWLTLCVIGGLVAYSVYFMDVKPSAQSNKGEST